jgi:quinolinate synthase
VGSIDETIQLIRIGEPPGNGSQTAVCSPALADSPWSFDEAPGYGPGASMADIIPAGSPHQGTLPQEYRQASKHELDLRIRNARQSLGERLVILGHYYQRDEVVRYADFVGDSFQLAQAAKTRPAAEAIVFCGVHFMAETADMLSRPDQAVILPNLAAGCSMADMADVDSVTDCWEELERMFGTAADDNGRAPVIPVTYMNSSAALKAFCGEHGGVVCTSSNADTVLRWAFQQGQRVLFFPDQHLGRNTAKAMGIPLDEMAVWDPQQAMDPGTLRKARMILWHGFCSVHKRFTVDQIKLARLRHANVRVIVHPECTMEVVDAADESGSTDLIRKRVEAAPPGSVFAIGTEINMVQRLASEHPEQTIFCLDSIICPCSTMYRIHPSYLAWVLESLERGEVLNRITVPGAIAQPARIALERMLSLQPGRA